MTMQNAGVGHETDVPGPGYWTAWGTVWRGADHPDPFQARTLPAVSAARQNEAPGHEIASSTPPGSIVPAGVHPCPLRRTHTSGPDTMAHSTLEGQAIAVGPAGGDVVQGAGSSDQALPSQSRTADPTTAAHDEVPRHVIPTRPAW